MTRIVDHGNFSIRSLIEELAYCPPQIRNTQVLTQIYRIEFGFPQKIGNRRGIVSRIG